jgi:Fe-S cluster biogenesis protein NfuA
MTKAEDINERVEKALDSIRPYLQTDGGNVKILEINENMELKLELLGACGNCPMSTMTLKAGVEEAVKREVPEIKSVEAINITSYDDPKARLPNRMM